MMYSKKKKGFSLAELLISLLIISIVLAAAIPTVTKRNAAGSEKIWHWSAHNNSVYSAVGSNQSVIIGSESSPFNDRKDSGTYFSSFFQDSDVYDNPDSFSDYFTTAGDKLVLFKKSLTAEGGQSISNMVNSHISFYTLRYAQDATTGDIHYAGRLAADKYNLALGIASLQSFNTTEAGTTSEGTIGGYNTALGHHSLTYNSVGLYNTAVGEKTLTRNKIGHHNTALGYSALMSMNEVDLGTGEDDSDVSENTAIGSLALRDNAKGKGNTAVGFLSQLGGTEGSYNTAIGNASCSYIKGDYNVCLGYAAGSKYPNETELDYSLNFGVSRDADDPNLDEAATHPTKYDTPLVTGVLQAYMDGSNLVDKSFQVNTKKFSVNTFDGNNPAFTVTTYTGDDGKYNGFRADLSEAPIKSKGIIDFDLLKSFEASDNKSLRLTFGGYGTTTDDMETHILSYNPNVYNSYNMSAGDSAYRDIRFNDMLKMDFTAGDASSNTPRRVDISSEGGAASGRPLADLTFNRDALLIDNNSYIGMLDKSGYPDMEVYRYENGCNANTEYCRAVNVTSGFGNAKFEHSMNLVGSNVSIIATGTSSHAAVNDKDVYIEAKENVKVKAGNGSWITFDGDIIINKGAAYGGVTNHIRITDGEIYLNKDGYQIGIAQKIRQLEDDMHTYHSDIRLKDVSGDSKAGLKEINALEVKNYTYKKDKKKTPHVGVIAQQLQKIFPNSVFEDEDGYLKIRTEEIFYAMVNSIKELFAMVQDLTAKVTGLDKRITELEQQNKLLKEQNEAFEKRLAKLEKQATK